LRKIGEEMNIDIEPQRIIGQNLCKINKHFLEFPFKRDYNCVDHLTRDKTIYHKNLFDFFHRYLILNLDIHCWKTICLIQPAQIHPLMPSLLSVMRTCQKKIIIS
jgi:hypothetical protein